MKFLSPEAIVLIFIALTLDILGLVSLIPIVGWIINIVIVLLGTAFFEAYDWFKGTAIASRKKGTEVKNKGLQKETKGAKWLKRLRWIRPIVEFIPYLNWVPLWTVSIVFELCLNDND